MSVTERFERAEAALDREYRQTGAELDALEAFLDEVGALSPATDISVSGPSGVRLQSASTTGLDAVREAYESTMMAVPHFEEEYGESYAEHVRMELGPDVATLLTSGQLFGQHHKQVVLAAAHDARMRRAQLLEAYERERDSLAELSESVCGITTDTARIESADFDEQPPSVLDGYHSRVGVLDTRCHELVDRRQSTLVSQRRSMSLPITGPDIPTCVYNDLDVAYPIVATCTELLDRLADLESDLDRRLAEPA